MLNNNEKNAMDNATKLIISNREKNKEEKITKDEIGEIFLTTLIYIKLNESKSIYILEFIRSNLDILERLKCEQNEEGYVLYTYLIGLEKKAFKKITQSVYMKAKQEEGYSNILKEINYYDNAEKIKTEISLNGVI